LTGGEGAGNFILVDEPEQVWQKDQRGDRLEGIGGKRLKQNINKNLLTFADQGFMG